MASTSSKSSNPFARQDTNLDFFQDSYLPRYYEQDIYHSQRITFRSISPKIYHQKQDYFDHDMDELNDDSDALYEQALLNSNLFADIPEKKEDDNHALQRLRQILDHMNPHYYQQPISNTIPQSVRSQFSSSASSSSTATTTTNAATNVMRSISIPDHRDSKGKGKLNNPSF